MNRRRWLWALLIALLGALLIALIWLVGRYEQARFEDQLERTAQDWTQDIRAQLSRNTQRLRLLSSLHVQTLINATTQQLLQEHPEMLRIEIRDVSFTPEYVANSPFLPPLLANGSSDGIFQQLGRHHFLAEMTQACALAKRSQDAAYGANYFVPFGDGRGLEVIDVCLPHTVHNNVQRFVIVTYALEGWLKEWIAPHMARQLDVSLVEADGARLAAVTNSVRVGERFFAQSLVDLPGNTLILRVESWHSAPYWLANTPTALVLALALALGCVLWLLLRDTRKRLRAEASLRQSQERLQRVARLASLGEMASLLSHELNQPLAAIASYAAGSLNVMGQTQTNAALTIEDKQDIQTALERIALQSERAGQVIKSVHDFVRRRDTERIVISPQALFDAALPLLRLQAKQSDIRIEVDVAQGTPNVWCDKTLIEQVIINLARNGLQAMAKPSQRPRVLQLKAMPSGPHLVLFHVIDTGQGLTPEVADKLFTPFFTTKDEGTGLGLSLCRTVIEQHGGSLTYTSETDPLRCGTCFQFKLMTHITSLQQLQTAYATPA